MAKPDFDGLSSDWSEGTFKMARLHDIQVLINHYKTYPTARSENKFNFEHWFQQILNLRDEGDSKYTSGEKKECDKSEEEIQKSLNVDSPCKIVNEGRMGSQVTKYLLFKDKLDLLIKKIRKYEQLVKFYNDSHGLTTKNANWDDDGL